MQDRVIQTYEGCVYMDFEKEYLAKNGYGQYTPLAIPPGINLYMAYKTQLGKVSGTVLNTIRTKYEAGDAHTHATLKSIAALAEKGKAAIENNQLDTLSELINENFNLRTQIMKITPDNLELVECARACGVSASFTGSGGAIIGIYPNDRSLVRLHAELKKINANVIKPIIA